MANIRKMTYVKSVMNKDQRNFWWAKYSSMDKIYKGCHTFEQFIKEVQV